jgi:putative spermidine/putrescine transport system permease protein
MSSTTPPARRITGLYHRHPRLRLATLLSAPMAWLVLAYLGSLTVLLLSAFWSTDDFTSQIVHAWTGDNFHTIVSDPVYWKVARRTLGIAVAVTVLDIVIAFPLAFYMAHIAKPRYRSLLLVLILTPLWAGYLVKAYAWWAMFSRGGVLDWLAKPFGGSTPGFGVTAVIVVLAYLWLPYMVLPIYTSLEQLPPSVLAASADLGAKPGRTFGTVILPLLKPAIVAGSVFTFSLSLGDYITMHIVGGNSQMLGNVIADSVTLNLPLAAALSFIPVLAIVGYLVAVRRTGALENL